jgi:molecular chaperone DnaK (HSP70)
MKVGIDLGTTNSALSFIDEKEAADADFPPIHVLDIPQTVAQGRVEARRTLPSFLFLGDQIYVGAYARDQGAVVPTKSVHSAKSWLSNPDVDRSAKILPWDAQEAGRVLSPVEVSTKILNQMGEAWNSRFATALADQDIVLTVPASFDEEARELTVAAAREAGFQKLTLLEEPVAAFYSWIANDLTRSQKFLFDGQHVLVCDVGGGTSDFTLIKVSREGDRVDFTRTAVGKHLLLGGDNLDLTLAWLVESKLQEKTGQTLSIRQRSALRRQCAAAKEKLLGDQTLASVEVTVLGAGTSLIGGTLKTEITREEALELALEGFLPFCALDEKPKEEKRSLFRELGLPYVSDPAVTRHLAAFLGTALTAPDAILFNGGFFIPDILRNRVVEVIEKWFGKRPLVLENRDLDLAVSVGAAYYSYVRSTGAGLLVRGGLPRAYFLGIASGNADQIETLCLVPRGSEEGATLELDNDALQLVANKPVSFRMYSSLIRTEDKAGDHVAFAVSDLESDLRLHAPLNAVIRFGKSGERLVPVKLGAKLTEVGTLEIWADSKISEHRWRLQFELRKSAKQQHTTQRAAAVVSEEHLNNGVTLLNATFAPAGSLAPEELPALLEQRLGLGRNSWPLSAIRVIADKLLELSEGRKKSAAHELRWLSLCGFCLRPGFGFPGDDYRIEQARRVYAAGITFPNQIQNEIEWWIFCGRVAGGLNRNQQFDIFQRIAPMLLPKGNKKPPRVNSSLAREMWRAASSLELLPVQTKTQLGDALVERIRKNDFVDSGLWCVSRLGARKLFYGPNNLVVPSAIAARWMEAIVRNEKAEDAVLSLARVTGDTARDLPAASVDLARKAWPELDFEAEESTDLRSLGRIFGEELPSGLVMVADEKAVESK